MPSFEPTFGPQYTPRPPTGFWGSLSSALSRAAEQAPQLALDRARLQNETTQTEAGLIQKGFRTDASAAPDYAAANPAAPPTVAAQLTRPSDLPAPGLEPYDPNAALPMPSTRGLLTTTGNSGVGMQPQAAGLGDNPGALRVNLDRARNAASMADFETNVDATNAAGARAIAARTHLNIGGESLAYSPESIAVEDANAERVKRTGLASAIDNIAGLNPADTPSYKLQAILGQPPAETPAERVALEDAGTRRAMAETTERGHALVTAADTRAAGTVAAAGVRAGAANAKGANKGSATDYVGQAADYRKAFTTNQKATVTTGYGRYKSTQPKFKNDHDAAVAAATSIDFQYGLPAGTTAKREHLTP